MKSIISIIFISFLAFSCTMKNEKSKEVVNETPEHVGDIILSNIESNYGSFINNDTLNDGTLFYSVALKGEARFASEKNIIGLIDKTLEKVPDEIKENVQGVGSGYLYNSYKWNTPLITLKVQSDFYVAKDSIYVRLWMNKK